MPRKTKPKMRQVALTIGAAVKAKSWKVDDLAKLVQEKVDVSYEQIRRVVRGHKLPSESLLDVIGTVLELDLDSIRTQLIADQIRDKFGLNSVIAFKKNPELQPIEIVWSALSHQQKESIISTAEAFARVNVQRI